MVFGLSRRIEEPEIIDCGDYEVTVKRTDRKKSVSVEVKDGIVFIAVPRRLRTRSIEEILSEKHQWILGKLAIHQDRTDIVPKTYVDGEQFLYQGRWLSLKVEEGRHNEVVVLGDMLIMRHTSRGRRADPIARGRRLIRDWYVDRALKVLTAKAEVLAAGLGRTMKQISVRDFKSRWGSCSRDNVLMFNWRIMMAPESVIDYLVAHECAHMVHHNHSNEFWALVEDLHPSYKTDRKWLKINGYSLDF